MRNLHNINIDTSNLSYAVEHYRRVYNYVDIQMVNGIAQYRAFGAYTNERGMIAGSWIPCTEKDIETLMIKWTQAGKPK